MTDHSSSVLSDERIAEIRQRIADYFAWMESPEFEPCPRCQGKGYHHGFGENGADPDWCLLCGGPGEQPTEPGTWCPEDLLRDLLSVVDRLSGEQARLTQENEQCKEQAVSAMYDADERDALLDAKEKAESTLAEVRAQLAQANRELSRLEGVVLPHARRQENANGFQRGWHAALSRVSEGDTWKDLSALVPEPAVVVEVPVCEVEADDDASLRHEGSSNRHASNRRDLPHAGLRCGRRD